MHPNLSLDWQRTPVCQNSFSTICTYHGVTHLNTSAYNWQSNDHLLCCNQTFVTYLRQDVVEHRKDWDTFVQPLKYGYNIQIHCPTNTAPSSLVLSRRPPGPTLLSAEQPHHTAVPSNTSVQAVRRALEAFIQTLCSKANSHMHQSWQQNKWGYDKLKCVTFTFTPGDMKFVHRPPLPAAARHSANMMPDATYNRLLARALRSFCVVLVQPHNIRINEKGVPDTVSIDRSTRRSGWANQRSVLGSTKIQTRNYEEHVFNHAHPTRAKGSDDAAREYIVQRNAGHVSSGKRIEHVLNGMGTERKKIP